MFIGILWNIFRSWAVLFSQSPKVVFWTNWAFPLRLLFALHAHSFYRKKVLRLLHYRNSYFPEYAEYVCGKIRNGLSLFYQISDNSDYLLFLPFKWKSICNGFHFPTILLCSATETVTGDVLKNFVMFTEKYL